MPRPYYILFAGINGAGKSTLYRSGMWQHGHIADTYPRINTDEILSAQNEDWSDPQAQFRAGREAIRRIKHFFARHTSFNQETTLAGKSIVRYIKQAHEAGYYIVMFYIGVEDTSIAQERITHRESIGGHGIDSKIVIRRQRTSVKNLVHVLDICDEAYLYDNTSLLNMVARFELGELAYCAIDNPSITWHHAIIQQLGYEPISL